jgi:hypothetical protein
MAPAGGLTEKLRSGTGARQGRSRHIGIRLALCNEGRRGEHGRSPATAAPSHMKSATSSRQPVIGRIPVYKYTERMARSRTASPDRCEQPPRRVCESACVSRSIRLPAR